MSIHHFKSVPNVLQPHFLIFGKKIRQNEIFREAKV